MNLSTATPIEIDTVLYDLYQQQGSAAARLDAAQTSVLHTAGARRNYHGVWDMTYADAADALRALEADTTYRGRQASEALDRVRKAHEVIASLREQAAPLNAEFDARGGWTRAFLAVTNGSGHVHSSMGCSTCNRQGNATRFAWMVEFSGKDEAEIVEAAGERACTVCYPSAPVETLRRPTKMFSEEEIAAQQAREAREQAKVARLATKVAKGLTEDGSEFVVEYVEHNAGGHEYDRATGKSSYVYKDRPRREHFKTEQAAVQWVVQYIAWGHDGADDDMRPGFEQVAAAVAKKHGKTLEQVWAEIAAKVAAKKKRDAR